MNLKKHRSIYNEVHTLKDYNISPWIRKIGKMSSLGWEEEASRVSESDKGKFCSRFMKVL